MICSFIQNIKFLERAVVWIFLLVWQAPRFQGDSLGDWGNSKQTRVQTYSLFNGIACVTTARYCRFLFFRLQYKTIVIWRSLNSLIFVFVWLFIFSYLCLRASSMYYNFNHHANDAILVTIEAIVCREYSIPISIIELK